MDMNKDDISQGSLRRQREKQSPEDCQKMRIGPETLKIWMKRQTDQIKNKKIRKVKATSRLSPRVVPCMHYSG